MRGREGARETADKPWPGIRPVFYPPPPPTSSRTLAASSPLPFPRRGGQKRHLLLPPLKWEKRPFFRSSLPPPFTLTSLLPPFSSLPLLCGPFRMRSNGKTFTCASRKLCTQTRSAAAGLSLSPHSLEREKSANKSFPGVRRRRRRRKAPFDKNSTVVAPPPQERRQGKRTHKSCRFFLSLRNNQAASRRGASFFLFRICHRAWSGRGRSATVESVGIRPGRSSVGF